MSIYGFMVLYEISRLRLISYKTVKAHFYVFDK